MHDVSYIVTEQGAARMHAATMDERMRALIKVADPRFRPELWRQYNQRRNEGLERAERRYDTHVARKSGKVKPEGAPEAGQGEPKAPVNFSEMLATMSKILPTKSK